MYKLYWIDDSAQDMDMIVNNVFPDLWDNDVASSVVLFGNAYCQKEDEKGPTEEDCNEFHKKIKQRFSCYCIDVDKNEWEKDGTTHMRKENLIDNCSVSHIPIYSVGADEFKVENLVKKWTDKNFLSKMLENDSKEIDEFLNESEMAVDELITAMNISADAVVALDIYLLYHDDDRISSGLPNISMALYHSLSKQNLGCYVYSSMASSKPILNKWKEVYRKVFSEEIQYVHQKFQLITKEKNTEEKMKLIDFVKQKGRTSL